MKNHMIILIFFIGLVFVFVHLVPAQNDSNGCSEFENDQCAELIWQEVALQSGEVAEIVISPSNPDIIYAGFEVNSHSLYKSIDGGKNWKRVEGGGDHTKDIAVSPTNPNLVYFAMSEPLETTDLSFRSTARSVFTGPSMNRDSQIILSTGIPPGGSSVSFSSVEIFEGDEKIIYAARKGGSIGPLEKVAPKIYKSIDGGKGWEEVEPNLREANVLAIHPTDPHIILIGSDGVYLSKDSGKTLSLLTKFSNTISIEYQIDNPDIIYAASDSKILKTVDGGNSWRDITGNLKDIHRVRVSRSHPNILYASTFNGVFRSNDSGSNWFDASGDLKSRNIQIVEIHPKNPDIAFIGHSSLWSSVRAEDRYKTGLFSHQGIFKTEDGGKTWARSDAGIKEYNFEEVAINPNKMYEAWVLSPASRGGYKTEDGGYNWRLTQTPTFHYPMKVKYSNQNPDKVFATGWQNNGVFSYSEDGGINWNLVSANAFFSTLSSGMPKSEGQTIHLHGLAVDPTNDKIVYAGSVHDAGNPVNFLSGAHIFKSVDSGMSWKEIDNGFPHEEETAIHDIKIDPQNTNIIYIATTSHESEKGIGVYKSIDSGVSWSSVNNGLSGEALSVNAIIIHPEDTDTLLAATFGGLYKSTNAGQSWAKTSDSSSFDVEYVIDEPEIIYASTDDGVLKSRDFGSTWYKVNLGLPIDDMLEETGGGSGRHLHFGAGIGVDTTGEVIYAAFQNDGLYVARLSDKIIPQETFSETGNSPYNYGPGEFENLEQSGFFKKIFIWILIGLLIILVAVSFSIRIFKRKQK